MSAMDELNRLCELLDERGVEYNWTDRLSEVPSYQSVIWWFNTADKAEFREYHDGSTQLLIRSSKTNLTPEQAIAATLGSCNCSNSERTETCKVDVLNTSDCAGYECGEYIMHCNGCGHEFGHVLYNEDGDVWMSEPPNFCPNCGRRLEVDA